VGRRNISAAKPVALITGGAKGIGRAIARHLGSCGWQVAVIDLPDSGLRRTFARERHAFVIEGDVRDEETRRRRLAAVSVGGGWWNPTTQELIPILREDDPNYRQNQAIITGAMRRWNGGTSG
jgi:NAD(P)-dependent dehydrogenase (short-subunit alcohol dehydrogenase family)